MKNKITVAAALLVSFSVIAQTTPDSTKTTAPVTTNPPAATPATATVPTALVDASVHSAYIADAETLKGLTTETLKPEHSFPVLGTYTATGTASGDVTISLDPVNKGIVWVEGLSQGKFKALMKKAPSTYKIPAQKTESGNSIAEGTLFLNPASNELTIVLGQPFNDANPVSDLSGGTKQKTKAWRYTGIKSSASAAVAPAPQQ